MDNKLDIDTTRYNNVIVYFFSLDLPTQRTGVMKMVEKVISMAQWKRKYFEQKQRADDYEKLLRITWMLLDSHYDSELIAEISNAFDKHKGGDK